jgi:DNA-binding SARP family transcriptional activator
VDFRVLGPLEVHTSEGSLPLGSGRLLRSLLALFLSRPNQVISSDVLVEQLWSEEPPPSAATALRVHLTRLRTRLEPDRPRGAPSSRLVTESPGYRLCVERDELDSLRFEQLIELARRAESPALAASAFAEADLLWRGTAFAEVDDLDPVRAEAARLQELRAAALEESFDIRLALGEHAVLVAALQNAVDQYPLRERLSGQLMLALYRSGRQAEALRTYSQLRERLGEELGIDPDVALSRLETAIIRHEPELDLDALTPEPSSASTRTTTVLVGGDSLATVASAFEARPLAHDDNEVSFSFRSAADALRCAAEVLRIAQQARIGMSVGDSPHVAARDAAALLRAAPPGSILASEAATVMAGAHSELEFEALGPSTLDDGRTTLAAAGRLPARAAPESSPPMPALLVQDDDFWFAGRTSELEIVDDTRREVEQGAFRVVLFSGEAGIGKTRLAAEAARHAHARGWTVLYGRCDDGVRTPFQPFVDTLEFFVEHTSDEVLADRLGSRAGELSRLVPALTTRRLDLESPLHSDPETERYQLFQAVADWLRASASNRPVMLVLDDLQWAAPPTLLLLRYLVRMADLDGLLLLATYRDTKPERNDALDELVADLSLVRRVRRCPLEGLDAGAVYELLAHEANMSASAETDEVAGLIHAETDGNPFFVHELIRQLSERGTGLSWDPGAAVPPSVRDVIAQRLARLPSAVDDLVTAAAVIGRHFDVALLSNISATEEDDTLYLLDIALEARLVQETGFDEYRFSHALVQSALYQALTETRRVRLHRRVAEALEDLSPDRRAPRLPELAHHFLEAGPAGVAGKAVRYAMQASDAALQSLAFEDAANLCRQAMVAVDVARTTGEQIDPTDECDLAFRLGRAELRAGQAGGRATLLRAFGMAQAIGDPARMAEAVLAINRGFFSRIGRTDHRLVVALEAALAAQPDTETDVRARLLATLASEIVWSDDGERRFDLSDEALAMARRIGEQTTIANVLLLRSMTISSPETLAQRLAECDELLSIGEAIGDPALLFQAAFHASGTAMEAGNAQFAVAMVERAGRLAQELNQPTLLFLTSMMRTGRLIYDGALDEAETGAYATLELGQRANQHGEAMIFFSEHSLEIRRWQDRLPEMLPDFADLAGLPGIDFSYPLVRYLYDAGEEEAALAKYREIMDRQPLPPRRDLLFGATLCNLGYLAARAGDVEHASRIYAAFEPLAGQFANTTIAKPVTEHFLGLLAGSMGDNATAEEHFAAAVPIEQRAQAPLLVAETQLEWARLLATSGRDPDRLAALCESLREAATTYRSAFLQRAVSEL